MGEATDLSGRMAHLARDLQHTTSSTDTLQHVVESAVELLGPCDAAGISIVLTSRRIETAAGTGRMPSRLDEMQQELGEGPCLDAAWEHELISVPDLERETRWPTWAPRAIADHGVHSMVGLRLFTHGGRLGVLNLYSLRRAAFTADDLEEATAIAAHGAVAMAAANTIDGLGVAIHNRTVLGQATGLVMARYDMTATQSFNLLKRLSSEQNVKLVEVAHTVVKDHHAAVDRRVHPSTTEAAPTADGPT